MFMAIIGLTLCVSSAAKAAEPAFPAFVDTRVVDGDLVRGDGRFLFDGTAEYLYPGVVPDIDGDGLPDVAFTGGDDADAADTLYVDLSADGLEEGFSSATLPGMIRLTGLRALAAMLYGRDDTSIRDDLRIIRDLDGDGVGEFLISSDDAIGVAVIFGVTEPGASVDAASLDGRDGFYLYDDNRDFFRGGDYFTPVGDSNGDGLPDFAIVTTTGEDGVWRLLVLPGRGSGYPASISIDQLADGDTLVDLRLSDVFAINPLPAGDINGDGIDDLTIRTLGPETTGNYLLGGTSNLNLAAENLDGLQLVHRCDPTVESCGVVPVGDVDDSGHADALLTRVRFGEAPGTREDIVLYGSEDGLTFLEDDSSDPPPLVTRIINDSKNLLSFGDVGAVRLGDLNGDGLDDFSLLGYRSNVVLFAGEERWNRTVLRTGSLDGSNGFRWLYPSTTMQSGNPSDEGKGSLLVGGSLVQARAPSDRPLSPLEVNVLAGPKTTDVFWQSAAALDPPVDGGSVSGYRISVDGEPVADVAADQRRYRLDSVGFDRDRAIGVQALGSDGRASLPGYRPGGDGDQNGGLRADVFGPYALELFWDRTHDNIVYRDDAFLATVDGGSYVDVGLAPGQRYRYFVVPFSQSRYDHFAPGEEPYRFFPEQLDADFPVRARTEEIEVETASLPGGGNGSAPTEGPGLPQEVRVIVYSSTAAEVFWSAPTEGSAVFQYEVARNTVSLARRDARSLFDPNLAAGERYTYAVTAIDLDGIRSDSVSVTVDTQTKSIGQTFRPALGDE